ncbi:hypothetical protein GF312_10185 [Candidatus Poribacteria bacterium]|nr:hypothetical protein [Candidatus Poribacteria bacterium]
MFNKHVPAISAALIIVLFSFVFIGESAYGDRYNYEYNYEKYNERNESPYRYKHNNYEDRDINREERSGRDMDDWIERGESSVTESPVFRQGVRLAACANHHRDEYALASAVYFFQIPPKVRNIELQIHYQSIYSGKDKFHNKTAGRVWIKNARIKDYRYDDTLHGDTFILHKNKNYEEIVVSANDHVSDGVIEVHVTVEGSQVIDLNQIRIRTFRHSRNVKVLHRKYSRGQRNGDYKNVYWHFYSGPIHHYNNGYYVRYTYPKHHRVEIRKLYRGHIHFNSIRRPAFRFHLFRRPGFYRHKYRRSKRIELRRWKPRYENERWR